MSTAPMQESYQPDHNSYGEECFRLSYFSKEDFLYMKSKQAPMEVLEVQEGQDAIKYVHCHVPDISEYFPAITRNMGDFMANWDAYLEKNPQVPGPQKRGSEVNFHEDENPAARAFFGEKGMRDWYDLVPNATALFPLQRPYVTELPNGGSVDMFSKQVFMGSLDAIGIRTRAGISRDLAKHYLADGGSYVSLACGAAVPALEAIGPLTKEGKEVTLDLVDLDQGALSFGSQLAKEAGLESSSNFYKRDLIRGMIAGNGLVSELGYGQHEFVDALGIFEYFRPKQAERFLKNAYDLVKPGGGLVVANMLTSRDLLEFNQRGAGWPKIYPRSLDELVQIIKNAGLKNTEVNIYTPQDGVYAVLEITKKDSTMQAGR